MRETLIDQSSLIYITLHIKYMEVKMLAISSNTYLLDVMRNMTWNILINRFTHYTQFCEEIYLQIKKLYRNICPSKFSSGQFFRIRNKQRKTMDFCLNLFFFFLVSKIRCGRMSKTYSVACANGMPMNDGLNVSVYISMPEPRRYSLVHTCMSGD